MSLKKNLIQLLLVSGAILTLLLYVAFLVTMRPSQEDQKTIFVEKLKKNIDIALSIEMDRLEVTCSNWADWESMANYVEQPSQEFETDVWPDAVFGREFTEIVLVARFTEDILFYKGKKDKKFVDFKTMDISYEINKIKRLVERTSGKVKAIINSGVGPVLVVAAPIVPGRLLNRINGVLILGRFIDENMLNRISSYTVETISALKLNPKQLNEFYNDRMKAMDLFYREQHEKLTVYHLLRDIDDKPAVVLYTQSDNELFRVMNRHLMTLIVFISLSIIFLGTLLYFSIDKQIVKRVLNITGSMQRIEGLKDLSNRVNEDDNCDEISRLVESINIMLDKLEQEKRNREIAEKSMITHGKLASIGRLASCIGHEVNNPLLAISNSIQVIKKISRSKSEIFKEAIEISESELDRIRDIISSLLDFHRWDKAAHSQVDVKKLVTQSLSVLEWSKKLGTVKVIRDMENSGSIYASPARLKQVFINFIVNAVEAMESSGEKAVLKIAVTHSTDQKFVQVHFIDNGPGIPQDIRRHLFEPFVSTKEEKGVGLGLYISYKIISNHGGEITYNDEYDGGTHFIISLPTGEPAEMLHDEDNPEEEE